MTCPEITVIFVEPSPSSSIQLPPPPNNKPSLGYSIVDQSDVEKGRLYMQPSRVDLSPQPEGSKWVLVKKHSDGSFTLRPTNSKKQASEKRFSAEKIRSNFNVLTLEGRRFSIPQK